jgi:hypothetical protein
VREEIRKINIMSQEKKDLVAFRWSRKGDQLLRKSGDWDALMTFSDHPVSRHSDIWNGYMRAAKTLVEAWEAEPFDLRDAPWGVVLTPGGFGEFSHAFLPLVGSALHSPVRRSTD